MLCEIMYLILRWFAQGIEKSNLTLFKNTSFANPCSVRCGCSFLVILHESEIDSGIMLHQIHFSRYHLFFDKNCLGIANGMLTWILYNPNILKFLYFYKFSINYHKCQLSFSQEFCIVNIISKLKMSKLRFRPAWRSVLIKK